MPKTVTHRQDSLFFVAANPHTQSVRSAPKKSKKNKKKESFLSQQSTKPKRKSTVVVVTGTRKSLSGRSIKNGKGVISREHRLTMWATFGTFFFYTLQSWNTAFFVYASFEGFFTADCNEIWRMFPVEFCSSHKASDVIECFFLCASY